ncbi:MAG: metallophosphoesterase [Polaromonas sp.]|nr:metallophosphoesterase [Polaromonas sp.]
MRRVNIQLLSDLHLESNPHFKPKPLPGADVLVLAGDIGSYQQGSLLASLGIADFGLARFSPLPAALGGASWPTPVLFVPGNHEYDGLEWGEAQARLRETCQRLGLIWLESETLVMQGVRFVGCTLWTDFDALTTREANVGASGSSITLADQLKAREKAFRAANFYLKKNHSLRGGEPMLAEAVREESLKSQAWLRRALAQPFDGPTVAVTHFAPSLLSADPRYGITPGTAGFCNSLDELLPLARLWLHGHLHCPNDYVAHGCRVVANPLGYARKGEQEAFRESLCITVKPWQSMGESPTT